MAQVISQQKAGRQASRRVDKPSFSQSLQDIDPCIIIAVLAVLTLALLGAGWTYFQSGPSADPSRITMPVEG